MTDAERQAIVNTAITEPNAAQVDGLSVTNRPIGDLLDAVSRQRANDSASKNHRGIRFNKLVPPGANG
jgi:hypothetical protein